MALPRGSTQDRMLKWRDDLEVLVDEIVTVRLSRQFWDELAPAVNSQAADWTVAGELLERWYVDSVLIQARRILDGDSRSRGFRALLHAVKEQASMGRLTLLELHRLHGGPFEPDDAGEQLARLEHGVDLVAFDRLQADDLPPPALPVPHQLTADAVQRHLDLIEAKAGVILAVANEHVAHLQRVHETPGDVSHELFDAALETIGALARHWLLLFGGPDVSLDVTDYVWRWGDALNRIAGK